MNQFCWFERFFLIWKSKKTNNLCFSYFVFFCFLLYFLILIMKYKRNQKHDRYISIFKKNDRRDLCLSIYMFRYIYRETYVFLKITFIYIYIISYLVDPASNICLSQRLSHACLSINNFILWNCVQLIKSVIIYLMVSYYTWIPVVILELIHAKNPDSRRDVFIR